MDFAALIISPWQIIHIRAREFVYQQHHISVLKLSNNKTPGQPMMEQSESLYDDILNPSMDAQIQNALSPPKENTFLLRKRLPTTR